MLFNESFLSILRCPACAAELELRTFEGAVTTGVLTCTKCDGWYPVTNGVPRLFIPGPLRPSDTEFVSKWHSKMEGIKFNPADVVKDGTSQVQKGFGHKWTRHPNWGIEGETKAVMDEWILPRYGWGDQKTFDDYFRDKKWMIDAGAGLGRETIRMAERTNGRVIGIELSECVDDAAGHAAKRGLKNILFVQADLNAPPLARNSFDWIISEGVLHHTPDTHKAFSALVPLLAKGGEFAFYVYRKKGAMREFADDYIREKIKDLPPDDAWDLMRPLTKFGKALSDLNAEIEVPEDIPLLGIRAGRHNVQRLIYYSMLKCYWNDRVSFEDNVLVNFDWYYPQFAWRHTEEEVRNWIKEAGLKLTHESIEDAGITVRAQK